MVDVTEKSTHHDRHHVVIIGGGFGGLYAAQSLKRAPVRVTLLDQRNFHLFQPLLYQVATGALSPANIAAPLRAVLKRQKNVQVLLGEATDIDPAKRRVVLRDGEIGYDSLIVATGMRHDYFGNDHWGLLAPGLKTIEDATEIRRRILLAFENAERETDRAKIRRWLTFVIIGAGPTGVELAGALAEIAHHTLRHDFRNINPADARILLVDAADRVLPRYPAALSQKAALSLRKLGVTPRTNVLVQEIHPDAVTIRCAGSEERIATHTILWAAGIRASKMGRVLHEAAGVAVDGVGRVFVEADLSLRSHPEIFVIGDLAHFGYQAAEPLPGTAPVAMQQGRYVARLIGNRLRNRSLRPFRFKDQGTMATIGRAAAVARIGRFRCSGYFAWLVWLFVHLMFIVEFENRLLVFVQWAWNYFTRNRSARLITAVRRWDVSGNDWRGKGSARRDDSAS